ncbi:hypothetical protein ACFQ3N_05350 [Virgibacillus byunsanensis]|uniref:General stress protein n=1 Tax=Virgibacillus byunsanensis TaxID=570945 RepID=A0ABW3LIR8_9BACI
MHEKDYETKEKGFDLAQLSKEQKDLLDKVEQTSGLVLVAYDNSQDKNGEQKE